MILLCPVITALVGLFLQDLKSKRLGKRSVGVNL